MTEKTKRKRVHDSVRTLAEEVVGLKAKIEAIELKHGLPLSPYRVILANIEEYYNQIADEFDDMPDAGEPPLQTLMEGYERVRVLHKRTVESPLYPHTEQLEEVRKVLEKK